MANLFERAVLNNWLCFHGRDYNGATTELLITFGADKEDEMNPAFDTPLHLAVEKHNSVSAVMLIKAGCDVNKKVKMDMTLSIKQPVHWS